MLALGGPAGIQTRVFALLSAMSARGSPSRRTELLARLQVLGLEARAPEREPGVSAQGRSAPQRRLASGGQGSQSQHNR